MMSRQICSQLQSHGIVSAISKKMFTKWFVSTSTSIVKLSIFLSLEKGESEVVIN